VFCVIYLVGLVLLVVDAAPNVHFNSGAATSAHRTLFYVGLAAVALGSGGTYRFSLAPLPFCLTTTLKILDTAWDRYQAERIHTGRKPIPARRR
jgi:hypothetical protein